MTPEERHLWYDFLKDLPLTVHKQKVIGKYIVDFYIPAKGIVIELDGRQHGIEENAAADQERDKYMESLGLVVLRYSNKLLNKQFRTVCEDILQHIYS